MFESSFLAGLNSLEPAATVSTPPAAATTAAAAAMGHSVIVHPAGCSDTQTNGGSRQDTTVSPWERQQVQILLQSCNIFISQKLINNVP
jgi:hypothetical protein